MVLPGAAPGTSKSVATGHLKRWAVVWLVARQVKHTFGYQSSSYGVINEHGAPRPFAGVESVAGLIY